MKTQRAEMYVNPKSLRRGKNMNQNKKTIDYLQEHSKGTFRWESGGGDVLTDKGDTIAIHQATPAACKAAVQLAQRKGWTQIEITGGDKKFQAQMYLQARLAGFERDGIECDLELNEVRALETHLLETHPDQFKRTEAAKLPSDYLQLRMYVEDLEEKVAKHSEIQSQLNTSTNPREQVRLAAELAKLPSYSQLNRAKKALENHPDILKRNRQQQEAEEAEKRAKQRRGADAQLRM